MVLQPESVPKSRRDPPPEFKFHSSCDTCLKAKIKCSQAKPSCARCLQQNRRCVYSPYRKIGRPSTKNLPPPDQQQRAVGGTARKGRKPHPQQISLPSLGVETRSWVDNLVHPTNPALHAEESVLVPHESWSNPELTGNINRLDYGLEGANWPSLDGLFDAPAPMLSLANHELASAGFQLDQVDPDPDQDELTGYLSPSSLSSRESPITPLPTPQTERGLFGIRSEFPFAAGHSLGTGPVLPKPLNAFPAFFSSSSSASSPVTEAGGFNLFLAPSARCTFQCYPDLINLLNDINEFQRNNSGIPLDVLLNLDKRVCKVRETVLRCPCCLVSPGAALTLMLITVVSINLLGLFERSCRSTDRDSGSSMSREESRVVSSIALDDRSHVDRGRSRNPLPYTTGHLTVGNIQLDETVKLAISRRLVRLYLERQLGVVQQLNQLLGRAEGDTASVKVTQELLRDQLRRLEHFVGFITLTD
ncbi:uncharacterized protein N7496_011809 [Penicillium cataractarum]|uniref:Zn(2)-C6 fungal-type domain-containing protein n=1 Tax=Penicillium cataractarum TaxID=2100454 RepID=A0A9W9UYE5_9EURO|nr:uncharacterized protein N7496_011809 [Penicillium cataractarum]KAJ5359396.1 hypothetical protein N7496_011809 [Penicillium cataractarum]